MYLVVIIIKTTTYVQKKGWGSEPPTQTTASYERVSLTLLPASTWGAYSVSCSLGSWWLFRAQTSATPPKFFSDSMQPALWVPRPPLESIA